MRFRLRTVMFLLTTALLWLGWHVRLVQQQRSSVRWVHSVGGIVQYDFEIRDGKDARPVPQWLCSVFGVDFFASPVLVSIPAESQIVDISPLSRLTKLEWLSLSGPVSDLSPIRGLKSLRGLDISWTAVNDLTPLEGLTSLEGLRIDGTSVRDLSPLAGLNLLKSLRLAETAVDDLTPLSGLAALKYVNIRNTRVDNLEPLRHLSELEVVRTASTR